MTARGSGRADLARRLLRDLRMEPRLDVILVAMDFSPGADLALARALALPLAPGASVVVLYVVAPDDAAAAGAAKARLDDLVARTAIPAGVSVVTETAVGEPYVEVIRLARAREVDLVVIGRHSRRPVRDLFIGSTAERTIRYGDTPVLVVNREPAGPYARPIVATDLGDCAKRVGELATRVLDEGVRVTLVHAYRIPFEGLQPTTAALDADQARRAHGAMASLITSLPGPADRWEPVITRGDARTTVAGAIAAREADLVVLGTHGRTGVVHMLVGSVAEWLIATSLCDVLVTRPTRFTFTMP